MSERYTHGHFGSVVDNHATRTAANSAAFLLPHLKSSDELLDLGCGPGSITIDLAQRVARAIGVDAAPEVVERARRDAGEVGRPAVEFEVADLYELPFEDETFDVVFAHQVLQHLADPVAAVREAARVLKRGGTLALRDSDYGTMVHDPFEPRIARWLELYQAVARANGGEPDAGRMLGGWVHQAGLADVTVSTSTWTYATPGAVRAWCELWTNRLLEARLGQDAIERGLASRAELEELAAGWRAWSSAPHPFFAFLHGEVLARKG